MEGGMMEGGMMTGGMMEGGMREGGMTERERGRDARERKLSTIVQLCLQAF